MGPVVSIIVIGLIVGALARLLVPSRHDISTPMTSIPSGIVGSFGGDFLGYLMFRTKARDGFQQPAGITGSFLGAVNVLLIWVTATKRRAVRR